MKIEDETAAFAILGAMIVTFAITIGAFDYIRYTRLAETSADMSITQGAEDLSKSTTSQTGTSNVIANEILEDEVIDEDEAKKKNEEEYEKLKKENKISSAADKYYIKVNYGAQVMSGPLTARRCRCAASARAPGRMALVCSLPQPAWLLTWPVPWPLLPPCLSSASPFSPNRSAALTRCCPLSRCPPAFLLPQWPSTALPMPLCWPSRSWPWKTRTLPPSWTPAGLPMRRRSWQRTHLSRKSSGSNPASLIFPPTLHRSM